MLWPPTIITIHGKADVNDVYSLPFNLNFVPSLLVDVLQLKSCCSSCLYGNRVRNWEVRSL